MARTSGRSIFKKIKPLINIGVFVFGLIPSFLRQFIWGLIDNFDGKIALLLRYLILKVSAKSVGDNVYIGKRVSIKNIQNLTLGTNVSLHNDCYLDAASEIIIMDNVSIAHQSSIISFDHTWQHTEIPIKYNPIELKPITINSDCWIGCGVRIMGGIVIGNRCIIGAGSVVTRSISNASIVCGAPAKPIKR